jgi:hypothetical protein
MRCRRPGCRAGKRNSTQCPTTTGFPAGSSPAGARAETPASPRRRDPRRQGWTAPSPRRAAGFGAAPSPSMAQPAAAWAACPTGLRETGAALADRRLASAPAANCSPWPRPPHCRRSLGYACRKARWEYCCHSSLASLRVDQTISSAWTRHSLHKLPLPTAIPQGDSVRRRSPALPAREAGWRKAQEEVADGKSGVPEFGPSQDFARFDRTGCGLFGASALSPGRPP